MDRLLLRSSGRRRRPGRLRDRYVDGLRSAHAERVEARLDFLPVAYY
jgi:hypothetical protein